MKHFVVVASRNMLLARNSVIGLRHASSSAGLSTEQLIDRIIRVDHAGELGADRIYAGQMAVLGKTDVGPVIQEMWDQEKEHLATFEKLIPENRVRPTALLPFWNVAGFALGAGSALLGKEGAMACTVAVESVIGEHYNDQIRQLLEDDPKKHEELLEILKKFRDDEMHHHDTGLANDAEKAPFYSGLTEVIKVGCRAAVWVAERV
ncbi:5-demethoxyubiquinone hydroxylase, mitochondrial-like [Anneissia japonica]|uniref:5-demethoxyubiquinone hydroxylase, mitochondrial-like n=1 Tax=Anneissia japonica TaxID=1529436 RepID=UPI00142590C4|nr:5-demethoxyubiquinone hydroxylase, mitochondrial-like [Anneissia japonica]XP_033118475.1 5-demethoxyubiquinone hydroxylase, mitochondrial-like [Anneissia japonica]